MYQTIIHATDLGENHFHLCEKALALARFLQAKFYLLHVIELPASVQLAQGLGFTELAKPSKEDALTVMKLLADNFQLDEDQLLVEIGSIGEQVQCQAKLHQADLIIIGQHHSKLASLGSNVSRLIHQAPCDVITMKWSES